MTYLALGMAAIGRPQYINIKTTGALSNPDKETLQKNAIAVLNTAYELGIRHFDTAPGYGIAEEIIHDWLTVYNHADVTVSTKWGYTYTANFAPDPLQHEVKEHSLEVLQRQWEASKKLLPHLNFYQIHSATLESGVLSNAKILQTLAQLKQEYQIEIGITTSGINQNETIQKALAVTVDKKPLFSVFQVTYNIFEQSIAASMHALKAAGATVIVKEGLANGRISRNKNFSQYSKAYSVLAALAEKYNVGTDAIALRFCMDTIQPAIVLSGAATCDQLKENIQATSVELTMEDRCLLQSLKVNSEDYWNERKKLRWN